MGCARNSHRQGGLPCVRIISASGGGRGEFFSLGVQDVTFNAIRQVLPDRLIEGACRAVGHVYRRRTLTPVVTVLHMLLAAIWPEESFQAGADLLWANFAAAFPWLNSKQPSSGSFAKARGRLPVTLWQRIARAIAEKADALSQRWSQWRGHRVVLVDGTCVSMPAEAELFGEFGRSTGRGGTRHYPLGRIVAVSLANTMVVLRYAFGRYADSEISLLRPLLGDLRTGDLLVGDRHFAGANLYAEYSREGLQFLMRAHQGRRVDRLRPVEVFADNDFIARLPVSNKHRRIDPSLPKTVLVRLIAATVSTRKNRRRTMWFVTSLLDAQAYPAAEIVELYGRRWSIETLFRQLKVDLHADVLRSRSAQGVRTELAARVTALNVVRCLMLQAADAHDQDPMRLSFAAALRVTLASSPYFATAPPWQLPDLEAAMLRQIAQHRLPARPGRLEPRAVRREKKHYPRLRITRRQWKEQWAA